MDEAEWGILELVVGGDLRYYLTFRDTRCIVVYIMRDTRYCGEERVGVVRGYFGMNETLSGGSALFKRYYTAGAGAGYFGLLNHKDPAPLVPPLKRMKRVA